MKYTMKSGKTLQIPDKELENLQATLKISFTDAVQCWLDDWAIDHEQAFKKLNAEDKAEMQSKELLELDEKAKGYRRENAKADRVRAKSNKPKTVHVADEKVAVFNFIADALTKGNFEYSIEKPNKLIHVKVNDKTIKLDFVELGKYKKGGAK